MKTRAVLGQLHPYVPGERITGGIKLSSNENPLGASPRATVSIRDALHDLNRYPDGAAADLRAAIASKWDVSDEMVVVGNGSDEILVMIAGSLIEPGTNAVTAAHTFSQYAFATRIFGGEIRTAPMKKGRFDLAAIADRIDASTRIIFLCSPNNPTGTIVTADELDTFLSSIRDDVLVVIDEAYGEYVTADDYPDTVAMIRSGAAMIRLRTFSKIYGLAAMRVGYGVARPDVIAAVSSLRQPFNVGTVAQRAATAALDDLDFVARSLDNNERQKARLYRFLEDRQIAFIPTEANFVCARFHRPAASDVARALHKRRIAVRPLSSFGMDDHLRITLGTEPEMEALYEALEPVLGG